MAENKTKQKSWVSELNQSETDIKRKEQYSKLLNYSSIAITSIILVIGLFYFGKLKLNIINPKIEISNTNEETPSIKKVELEKEIIPTIEKKRTQINESKKVEVVEKSNEITIDEKKTQNKIKNEKPQGRNGKYITYYDNGNKWVELFFKNGLREGTQYSWHKNGKIKSELNYANGKKNGSQKWWKKDGKILNHKYYEKGEWVKIE
jgi:antitoxin component YwqK of YwqJK toxin-antitoxin module